MIYLLEDRQYSYSYREIRENYERFCEMSDEDFIRNLKEALHLACFIAFLKELKTEHILADNGIIHELVHLLHIPKDGDLQEVRKMFKNQLKLA